jgi:hypothetical protein
VGERLQKWQEEVNKELEKQREAAQFHARPATVLVRLTDHFFQPRIENRKFGFIS